MTDPPASPAQLAYEAFATGLNIPLIWDELPDTTQTAWQAAACAAAEVMIPPRPFPPETPGPRLSRDAEAALLAEITDYWFPIIKPDGVLDERQILLELGDYSHLLNEVPKVYMAVTDGTLSKPHYFAHAVIGVYEDRVTNYVQENLLEVLIELYDDFEGDPEGQSILAQIASSYNIPDLRQAWENDTARREELQRFVREHELYPAPI